MPQPNAAASCTKGTNDRADSIFSGRLLSTFEKSGDLVPVKFQRDESSRNASNDHLYDHAARYLIHDMNALSRINLCDMLTKGMRLASAASFCLMFIV